jgi:N-acyl-L-homoserine lactone synthetase
MVAVINTVNRHRHAAALTAMHRDRYRVFVEGLKWPLPMAHDGIERDQFDTDTAVYLIDGDATQPHRGSLRLLPTTSAHLMAHAFVDLDPAPGIPAMNLQTLSIREDDRCARADFQTSRSLR